MRIVKVKHQNRTNIAIKDTAKSYYYICPMKVNVGDYVLLESRNRKRRQTIFRVGKVISILDYTVKDLIEREICPHSFVFCKLDIEDFPKRMKQVRNMKYRLRAMMDGTYTPSPAIKRLGLPENISKKLKKQGITSIGKLKKTTDEELLTIKGIGEKTLQNIHKKLEEYDKKEEVSQKE